MRRVWTATRGTTVAQSLLSMRQAAAGSLRFKARRRDFDKGKFARETAGPVALSRSTASRAGREYRQLRRRIHAARARVAARGSAWVGRTLYQGRGPESDAEL